MRRLFQPALLPSFRLRHSDVCMVLFPLTILTCALSALVAEAEPPWVVPVDAPPFRGQLVASDADGNLTFKSDQQRRTLQAANLAYWGQCVEQGRAGGVVLTDGSLVVAQSAAVANEQLIANSTIFGRLNIPVKFLAGILFRAPIGQQERDQLVDRLARPIGQSDLLLLQNGDEIAGFLQSMADGTISLGTEAGPLEIQSDRVAAVLFNPRLRQATQAAANTLRLWTGFSDGSRLLAAQLLLEKNVLTLRGLQQTWKTDTRRLVFLQPLGGRATYLSDLRPTRCEQTSYLDLPWPYQADRNVAGGMLRCGGQLYLKGLGVHSAARLVYTLPTHVYRHAENTGATAATRSSINAQSPSNVSTKPAIPARKFQAELGIDDTATGGGSARFRVLVDGRERFVSPILRGGDAPLPVSIDIHAARELVLVVDYADRADVLDRANWLNARLTTHY